MFGTAPAHRSRPRGKYLIAIGIALISLFSYLGTSSTNPLTGENQRVAISVDEEIALGLQSAPELTAQFGGVTTDTEAQARVTRLGAELVKAIGKDAPYRFEFTLLNDQKTVNAFALPGGKLFITEALYRLLPSDAEVAGVMAHEIGHVIERHAAEQMAKAQLSQGLTGAAVIATSDPYDPRSRNTSAIAALVGQFIIMSYGRKDELESDRWGVKLLHQAGYDPLALIQVMKVLRDASGGSEMPQFFSTHPSPEDRIQKIEQAIKEVQQDSARG